MKRCTIEDNELVVSILSHPRVYWWIADDYAPPVNCLDYSPFLSLDSVYVLLPRAGCLVIYVPRNGVTWEIHCAALPESRGSKMAKAMTDSIAWMFENTPCVKIVAGIPAYNHFALRLAKSSGMSLEGVNRKSFLKDGVLHDQIYFGINKEGPCPHYSP